ncbi:MAG: NlpC/P60 family protein [Pseudomonadota bacterium]
MNPVVDAARRWIGTPYLHQASELGVGADCLGLVRGVWREVCGAEPERLPAYTRDWAEADGREVLWSVAQRFFLPCDLATITPGTLLLFRMRDGSVAKHLGVLSEPSQFIHAYDRHGVVENHLTSPWRKRLVAAFMFPDGVR